MINKSETCKVSNTGLLATRLLENSSVHVFGLKHQPLTADQFMVAGYHNVLLYPAGDETSLDQLAGQGLPLNLVVPDGNWAQARRMAQKIQTLASLPCVSLPQGAPSEYILRSHPDPVRICTLEAIQRCVAALDPAAPTDRLITAFQLMRDRLLAFSGRRHLVPGSAPVVEKSDRFS